MNSSGNWLQTGTYTLTVYAPKWKGCEEFDEEARADVATRWCAIRRR